MLRETLCRPADYFADLASTGCGISTMLGAKIDNRLAGAEDVRLSSCRDVETTPLARLLSRRLVMTPLRGLCRDLDGPPSWRAVNDLRRLAPGGDLESMCR